MAGAVHSAVRRPQSFHVIRYDNRDTGQSSCFDFAKQPYNLERPRGATRSACSMRTTFASAHVAGASMGGMITQTLMIQQPKRVRSATIIMSSPLAGSVDGVPMLRSDDLAGPDPKWLGELIAAADVDADEHAGGTDRHARCDVHEAGRDGCRSIPPGLRDIATREVGRAINFAAQANHSLAIGASSPNDRRPLLRKTSIPTLVVHGTDDPILPYPHGKALADAIPGAKLLTIDGMGHDLPVQVWPQIIGEMIAVTQRALRRSMRVRRLCRAARRDRRRHRRTPHR